MENSTNRVVYIDQIKVFLTCMVVIHHAGQAYGNTGGVWIVSEAQKVDYLRSLFFFNAAYMMGFYFFISGYFMFFSLKRKTAQKFLEERLFKLGIPLAVFTFLIFTPLHYFLSGRTLGYTDFVLDLYFDKAPLAVGHLWFVASLLVYSIIYVLLSKIPIPDITHSEKFKFWYPLVYLALLIPVNVWVRQKYPIDTWVTWGIPLEVAHLPQYLSLFLLGALFNQHNWLQKIDLRIGLIYLGVSILLFLLQGHLLARLPILWKESVIESFLCVGLCLGLIVLFKKYGKNMNHTVKILSDNAYGIYLIHLLVVIGLQLFFKNFALHINLKFIFVSVLGIGLSCAISQVLKQNKVTGKIF
jgi:glucans biosynthesis protein C